MRAIYIAIALAIAILATPIKATTTEPAGQCLMPPMCVPMPEQPKPKPAPTARPVYVMPEPSPEMLALLEAIAYARGLPESKVAEMRTTISCESGWNPGAVGDGGTSFGLVQIHLPAHPHITEAEAHDPVYALTFMADEFVRGNEWKWTCWKRHFSALPYSST